MPIKVAIISIHNLTMRMLAESRVLQQLAQANDLEVVVLSPNPADRAKVEAQGLPWRDSRKPTESMCYLQKRRFADRLRGAVHHLLRQTLLKDRAEYGNLRYRFLEMIGVRIHQDRKRMPTERRSEDAKRSLYVEATYGSPFPKSWWIFRWLYAFYYSTWQHNNIFVESFFEEFQPDLVVPVHIQNTVIHPYVVAARRRGIPMLGIVASWDQPSTSGAHAPGMGRFVVESAMMRHHLQRFHGITPDWVDVVGFPQMDVYCQADYLQPRSAFLNSIGVPENHKLLVLASYPERWVKHYEPDLIAHLVASISRQAYGEPCSIVIRPHPIDGEAWQRLGQFHNPPHVIVEQPEFGKLDHLANLMAHADAVLTPVSSIALDAVALDTPVINLAIDGAGVDYYESSQRWYDWEHYQEVVKTGGTTIATTYEELDDAIRNYLAHPDHNREGRERLRTWLLDPLDGHSAERMAQAIIEMAHNLPDAKQAYAYPWWRRPTAE